MEGASKATPVGINVDDDSHILVKHAEGVMVKEKAKPRVNFRCTRPLMIMG